MTVDVYSGDEKSRDPPHSGKVVTVWAIHQPERTDNSTTARHLYVCSPDSLERQILTVRVSVNATLLIDNKYFWNIIFKTVAYFPCHVNFTLICFTSKPPVSLASDSYVFDTVDRTILAQRYLPSKNVCPPVSRHVSKPTNKNSNDLSTKFFHLLIAPTS